MERKNDLLLENALKCLYDLKEFTDITLAQSEQENVILSMMEREIISLRESIEAYQKEKDKQKGE